MRRRLAKALVLAFAALGTIAAAGTAAPPFHLTEAGGSRFPERAWVLSTPEGQRIQKSQVTVSENDHRVVDLRIVPADAGTKRAGTVLLIDSSDSMRGAPARAATKAALAFAAQRNVNQRLAVLAFNASTYLESSFTRSQGVLEKALAQPRQTHYGTHLYDAVEQATALIRAAGIQTGSIIVLSDGADNGSKIDLEQATKSARDADVRVFTVAFRSETFRPSALQQLAGSTGGSFSRADSAEALARIYQQLGLRLAREYVVTYNSIVKPGRPVRVTVSVAGLGKATAGYVAPTLIAPNAVFHRSRLDGIWQSWLTLVFISLLIPALLALAILVPISRRGSTVKTRVSDYVSMPRRRQGEPLISRVFTGTERSLERTRWWERFKDALKFADITIPPVQLIVGTLVLTLFAIWLLSRVDAILGLIGLGVPFLVRGLIMARVARKRRLFDDQLADNLDVLSSGLRAGHSLVGAFAVVVNNAPEPSRSEFQRVVADEQLGISIEDALGRVATRMRNRDVEQVALVASVQEDTGGNAAEVLDRVTENIRERAELRRLVSGLTAQGRLARWIVSALPVGLLILISVINTSYMKPLFTHSSGRIALAIAGLMIVGGSVMIGRIVDIEV